MGHHSFLLFIIQKLKRFQYITNNIAILAKSNNGLLMVMSGMQLCLGFD